jgi:DnaK suppressor protein
MDKKMLEKFKKRLLAEKEKIIGGIHNLTKENLSNSQSDASGDLSHYSTHMADVGSDSFERELALGLVSNEQEFLYKIDEALRAIDNGTFGNCESCNKPIKEARLNALPFAKLCISCQEKLESGGQ